MPAVGIRVEFDPADREAESARTPTPSDVGQGGREAVAVVSLFQFHVGLVARGVAVAVDVGGVEGADPGVGVALFEGGGEGEGGESGEENDVEVHRDLWKWWFCILI